MIITNHFLAQAQLGSVPEEMIDLLRRRYYPPDSAVVLGMVPTTNAVAIAIIRKSSKSKSSVATTCLTRYRGYDETALNVKRIYKLKK